MTEELAIDQDFGLDTAVDLDKGPLASTGAMNRAGDQGLASARLAKHLHRQTARRHLRDLSELVPLHQRYIDAVREAAQAGGAVLCDLAAGFDALPEDDVRQVYLRKDGIHPTKKGDAVIAEQLEACFVGNEELGLLWPGAEGEGAS